MINNIRLATKDDVIQVSNLYYDLVTYLDKNINYPHWIKGIYPNIETAQQGFDENSLFVLDTEGHISGTIILNGIQPPEYEHVPFSFCEPSKVLVVHTLAVSPKYLKMGIAKQLLDFTNIYAKNHNYKQIRLDAYEENIPAANLYDFIGYVFVGKVDLNLGLDKLFLCFQKQVL